MNLTPSSAKTLTPSSHKKLQAALKILKEAVAEVAEEEDMLEEEVIDQIEFITPIPFSFERHKNSFNLFCHEMREVWDEEKEARINSGQPVSKYFYVKHIPIRHAF